MMSDKDRCLIRTRDDLASSCKRNYDLRQVRVRLLIDKIGN